MVNESKRARVPLHTLQERQGEEERSSVRGRQRLESVRRQSLGERRVGEEDEEEEERRKLRIKLRRRQRVRPSTEETRLGTIEVIAVYYCYFTDNATAL